MSGILLHMGMGTGKTKVAIDLIQSIPAIRDVLVVAPNSVTPVWIGQIERHAARPDDWAVAECRGTVAKKLKAAEAALASARPKRAVIVNYESVWRAPFGRWALGRDWDLVVADECQKAKGAGSKVSKFFAALSGRARRRLGLSGTPMPQIFLDAYGSFRFLDPAIFGTSYTRFKASYLNPHPRLGADVPFLNSATGDYFRSSEARSDFNERYSSITFYAGEDVIDLPDAVEMERYCDLPPEAAKVYREMEEELVTWFREHEFDAANAMVLVTRLQQLTSGFCKTPEGKIVDVHGAKRALLRELFEDVGPDEPVVVFCRFQRDLDAVAEARREAHGDEALELSGRRKELARWQAGGPPCLAVQIQAGALGIDLTRAACDVFYSNTFSSGDYAQAMKRVHRAGQRRTVRHVHLLARGTVDERLLWAHAKRGEALEKVVRAIAHR